MKIIKEFESNDFARKQSPEFIYPNARWSWGLGDNGLLYGKGYMRLHKVSYQPDEWYQIDRLSITVPLDEMVKIVEHFGKLIVLM